MHFPPKFLQKRFHYTFSMVHLLHRLYGVDAPGFKLKKSDLDKNLIFLFILNHDFFSNVFLPKIQPTSFCFQINTPG